ncbi:MAG: hypothetical protein KGI19_09860 [Thaumarchaeota archaeon]|nr:hypothetical protein [Nitrososphaerota archaeon]
MMSFVAHCNEIANRLKTIPVFWDGKKSILEMKQNGFNQWKQMEWIGWYFEYLCSIKLNDIMQIPHGKKYGNVKFDGFYNFPWDFKSHAKESGNKIIVNDEEAIHAAIEDFGLVGLILAHGNVSYDDEKRAFQSWHKEIKGGESDYEIKRKERGAKSRLRKVSFTLQNIMLIKITEDTLKKTSSFQNNFRNSDGSPRRKKILLDITELKNDQVHFITF